MSPDRWTCPTCNLTVVINSRPWAEVAVRLVRDTHLCDVAVAR